MVQDYSHFAVNDKTVAAAMSRVSRNLSPTPLLRCTDLSDRVNKTVYCKLETVQPTGSFKVRGALNALRANDARVRQDGVITFSTGNHGLAVGWASRKVGCQSSIFLSEMVPHNKREALRKSGADVIVIGQSQNEAEAAARKAAASSGAMFLSAFSDADVIAGQGTLSYELFEQLKDIGTIITPLSGGGLASGIAIHAKAVSPQTQLIGVSMKRGAAMIESVRAGRPIDVEEADSLADSLGGGIGGIDSLTFPIVSSLFDEFYQVNEEQIAQAMAYALTVQRCVLEGAAAVPIALLLGKSVHHFAEPIVFIASGQNVDMDRLFAVCTKHQGALADV